MGDSDDDLLYGLADIGREDSWHPAADFAGLVAVFYYFVYYILYVQRIHLVLYEFVHGSTCRRLAGYFIRTVF